MAPVGEARHALSLCVSALRSNDLASDVSDGSDAASTSLEQFVLTPLFTVVSEASTHRLTTGRFGRHWQMCALSLTQFE